jgi:hypothetical protein
VTKGSHSDWTPPSGPPPGARPVRRGPLVGSYDPFYEFEVLAHKDDQPRKAPAPEPTKAQLELLTLLTSNVTVVIMGCLLAVVVFTLLVLMLAKVV